MIIENRDITICISSLNDGIFNADLSKKIGYIVCHQVTNGKDYSSFYVRHPNVRFIKSHIPGLSISRNTLLRLVESTYAYFTDDDIVIDEFGIITLLNKLKNSNCIAATGKVIVPDGSEFKSYNSKERFLSLKELARVSSVEILFNVKMVKSLHCAYDERFGLGSVYPSSEEFVLLSDLSKKNQRILFSPIVVCTHPPESSGMEFYKSDDRIKAKGAMCRRVFGVIKGVGALLFFSFSKWPRYRNEISLWRFIVQAFNGFLEIK
ncbi:MAG: hypothetical protein VX447_18030 [Pseudomonadota bacterium]|nr:hypothetical protein [Pseudomonadota bacterium]